MITLKLATYNEHEAQTLATLLSNASRQIDLSVCGKTSNRCETCNYRHLCLDIKQATLYAKEYKPIHK